MKSVLVKTFTFWWGTKVYKLGFSHDFSAGEYNLIHCNCLFVFLYFFSKGNGFAEANFEQILKDLKRIWAGGMGFSVTFPSTLQADTNLLLLTRFHMMSWYEYKVEISSL